MDLILILYFCSALSMGGFTALRQKQKGRAVWLCYGAALALIMGTAWLGWEFSPSFTMLFLAADVSLSAAGELLWQHSYVTHDCEMPFRLFSWGTFILGAVFVFPAVYIYAAGDDLLDGCVWASLAAGTALCIAAVLNCRRRGETLSVGAGAELWLLLSAGCFALFCGTRSVSLLPYGVGLLLLSSARLTSADQDTARAWQLWAGLVSASLMATLPALCQGGELV